MTRPIGWAICLLIAVCACSSRSGSSSDVRPDRNLITVEQIRNGHFQNAFEAVQALRPNWLTPRGQASFQKPSQIEVYYDATHLGTVETLRTIVSSNIAFIRWYDGTQAQQRYGIGHESGVILVSSQID
jgi:hypothetical protein